MPHAGEVGALERETDLLLERETARIALVAPPWQLVLPVSGKAAGFFPFQRRSPLSCRYFTPRRPDCQNKPLRILTVYLAFRGTSAIINATTVYACLQGRVKFPTGGTVREPLLWPNRCESDTDSIMIIA